MKTCLFAVALCFILLTGLVMPVFSQSEDDMFSGDMIEEDAEADAEANAESDYVLPGSEFTVYEGIDWGGNFTSRLAVEWEWRGSEYPEVSDIDDPTEANTVFELETSLFFDARPASDYRVFGKLGLEFPFSISALDSTDEEVPVGDINIEELYTDIPIISGLFLRFGVFNTGWGTGYFFSPADVLSTTVIDPENPDKNPQGPAALRLTYSYGTTGFTFYIVHNDSEHPKDLAYTQTVDLLIDTTEIGIGAWYRYDHPPSGMITLSIPIQDVDAFVEVKGTYGSDEVFLVKTDDPLLDPIGFDTETRDEDWFFDATVGLTYAWVKPDINLVVQYLYSSSEYENYRLPDRAINAFADDDLAVLAALALLDQLPDVDSFVGYGRHAGAASVTWRNIAETDFTFSCFTLMDIGDISGYLKPSVSYEISNGLKTFVEPTFLFGDSYKGRYTQNGTGWSLSFGAEFGAGKF